MHILEASLEEQEWQKALFANLLVLTCEFRYFWKWGNIRKRVGWNGRLRLLCTLCIPVSRKFDLVTLYTYVLAKILQNGAKLSDSWFHKSHEELEQLQSSCGKFKKLKFNGLLSKKYIPSPKTLYTEDLPNITLNYLYLCENSPN